MKIALFGCSWMTCGVAQKDWKKSGVTTKDEHMSVGYYFSKLVPEHWMVDCYAVGGTSIQFSTYWLSKCINDYDLLIFKTTNWFRYSYNVEPYEVSWKTYKPNFRLTTQDTNIQWHTIKASIETLTKQQKWWLKTGMNDISQQHMYKVNLAYAKNNADFVYAHMKKGNNGEEIQAIQNVLGEERFLNYCVDEGHHFGADGCKWEAKWLLKQLSKSRFSSFFKFVQVAWDLI